MNHLLIMACVCATIAALWCVPAIREYAVDWLPNPVDDLADRWGGALLCVLVIVLIFMSILMLSTGGHPKSSLGKQLPSEIEGRADPPTRSVSGQSKTGTIVTRDAVGKLMPVTNGTVRIGQNSSELTDTGTFQVALPDSPQSDTLVEIESTHFLSRFLRLDDPVLVQGKPIELIPKRRVLVIPSDSLRNNSVSEDIRRGLENGLGSEQIDMLSDDKLRDDVLERLYADQQNRALYDPKTLARVGNFNGATDGVFWSLVNGSNSFKLECKLVSLTTAKVEYEVSPRFVQGTTMEDAAESAADLLLSQMARAQILSPKDTANVIRNISVRGYSEHVPKTWTLWIGVLPEGNDKMFPQRRLSTHGDQSFYAPDVYAGPEGTLSQPICFELYVVLAGSEYSRTIEAYIESGQQSGLDMNAWNKDGFKILDHVAVVRQK
jgi:hypothetical protein